MTDLLGCEKQNFYCFGLLVFLLQQALEHNSFLSTEKKVEQGNVEQAFKYVDQILEGKWSWAREVTPLKLKALGLVIWFEKY